MWLATGLHHETETGNEIALLRLKMIFVNGLTKYWYINIAMSVSLREIVTGLLLVTSGSQLEERSLLKSLEIQ